jgi:hypothetical protein
MKTGTLVAVFFALLIGGLAGGYMAVLWSNKSQNLPSTQLASDVIGRQIKADVPPMIADGTKDMPTKAELKAAMETLTARLSEGIKAGADDVTSLKKSDAAQNDRLTAVELSAKAHADLLAALEPRVKTLEDERDRLQEIDNMQSNAVPQSGPASETTSIQRAPSDEEAPPTQEECSMKYLVGTSAFALCMAASAAIAGEAGTPMAINEFACDPGFHWAGPQIGCLGETIHNRAVLQAFDEKDAGCQPGEKRTIQKAGVMPNGRAVTWKVEQTCTP